MRIICILLTNTCSSKDAIEERLLKEHGRNIEVGGESLDYRSYKIELTQEKAKTVRTPKDLEKISEVAITKNKPSISKLIMDRPFWRSFF